MSKRPHASTETQRNTTEERNHLFKFCLIYIPI